MLRFFTLLCLPAMVLCGCSGTPPCEDKYAAHEMAGKFIKNNLRSPSTVNFPNYMSSDVSITAETLTDGSCAFHVRTYVDAQNGFGATVRERFAVTVAPDGAGRKYKLIDITKY